MHPPMPQTGTVVRSRRGTVVAVRQDNGLLECRFVPDDDPRQELSLSRLPKDLATNYSQPIVDLEPYLGLMITVTGFVVIEDGYIYDVSMVRIACGTRRNIVIRRSGGVDQRIG